MALYKAVRTFHYGGADITFPGGTIIEFDGQNATYTRRDGVSTNLLAPGLLAAIRAKLLVEASEGEVSLTPAPDIVKKPQKVAPEIQVQNYENQVCAQIKLPEKIAGRVVQRPEDVKAVPRPVELGTTGMALRKEALGTKAPKPVATVIQDTEDVKRASIPLSTAVRDQHLLEHGITAKTFTVETHIPEGTFVAKIKTSEEMQNPAPKASSNAEELLRQEQEENRRLQQELREARLKPTTVSDEDLKKDTAKALQKRAEAQAQRSARIHKQILKSDVQIPGDYPKNGHWMQRLAWCRKALESENGNAIVKAIYKISSESFQKSLKAELSIEV